MTNTVYFDDPDASWTFTVTDKAGNDLDWTPVEVAADSGPYDLTATWEDVPSASRKLKVSLAGLAAGMHRLYLKVPGGNDLTLGSVYVRVR
jgi:hypothetical protein